MPGPKRCPVRHPLGEAGFLGAWAASDGIGHSSPKHCCQPGSKEHGQVQVQKPQQKLPAWKWSFGQPVRGSSHPPTVAKTRPGSNDCSHPSKGAKLAVKWGCAALWWPHIHHPLPQGVSDPGGRQRLRGPRRHLIRPRCFIAGGQGREASQG